MVGFSRRTFLGSAILAALTLSIFSAKGGICEVSTSDEKVAFPEEMDLVTARAYVMHMINNDRKKAGLNAIVDDPVATIAAQTHADEMALQGYLGHYDLQGRKPWERYSEVGGTGYVAENTFLQRTGLRGDAGNNIQLDENARFRKSDLDRAQNVFMSEVAPNDGHKRNILDQRHDGVGVGLAIARGDTGFRFGLTQEFINCKGQFSELPKQVRKGQPFTVAGRLAPGTSLYSVSVLWDRLPAPMKPDEISKIPSYAIPEKKLGTYWPPPYASAIPIALREMNGMQEFAMEVTPGNDWKPGIYYVEIWVRAPRVRDPFPTSSRTMRLES